MPPDRPRQWLFRLYAGVVVGSVAAFGVAFASGSGWQEPGLTPLLAWALFCAVANVLPVPAARNLYLSVSSPVNIAIAFLFEPAAAAVLVAVGSVSEWEIRRQTLVVHAVFNRAQLGLAAAAASGIFAVDRGDHVPAIWILAGAVAVYQAVNWVLVGFAEHLARGTPLDDVLDRLLPANPVAALTYVLLGLVGIALALAYTRIGAWSVALLMAPLLGARQAVRVSQELERTERERRALADRVIGERERERARIASDLHDVVLQELAALQLQADNIATAIEGDDGDLARRLAVGVHAGIDGTVESVRRTIVNLRRASLDEEGLRASLDRYIRGFTRRSGVEVGLRVELEEEPPISEALLLFESCQELLANVAAHAGAHRATVELTRRQGMFVLAVTDDGVGMGGGHGSGGLGVGLSLLREKVSQAGGSVAVATGLQGGTRVTVELAAGGPR